MVNKKGMPNSLRKLFSSYMSLIIIGQSAFYCHSIIEASWVFVASSVNTLDHTKHKWKSPDVHQIHPEHFLYFCHGTVKKEIKSLLGVQKWQNFKTNETSAFSENDLCFYCCGRRAAFQHFAFIRWSQVLNQCVSVPTTIKKNRNCSLRVSQFRSFLSWNKLVDHENRVFQSFSPHVTIDTDSNYID